MSQSIVGHVVEEKERTGNVAISAVHIQRGATGVYGIFAIELMFVRDIRGPLDVLNEEWIAGQQSNQSVVAHILSIREKLEAMNELA